MSSRLPVELYKTIIDNLERHEDRATLHACSLTCKAFLHASRFILFHDLRLSTTHHLKRLEKSPANLCRYVRRLFLEGEGLHCGVLWDEALPLIAPSLQHITTLMLGALRWGMVDDTARSTLLSGFPCVEELNVYCRFDTSAQMNELLASFPSLTKLTCDQSFFLTYLVPVYPLPLGITSITLSSSQAKFFDHLLSLESHPIVRNVGFGLMSEGGLKDVGMLLKKLGSHVEHLDLGPLLFVDRDNPQCHLEEYINLSHNTNLRSIQLLYRSILAGYPRDVVYVLWSQIASAHLEQVGLKMCLGDLVDLVGLADLYNVDWLRIDDYFSQERWANLRNLVFILLGGRGEVALVARDFIKARLPLLGGRVAVELVSREEGIS